MFGKRFLGAALSLAMILSLAGAVTALAGAPTGAGPDSALAPSNGWVQLAPGQQVWYAFDSSGAGSDATDAQITAELTADPAGSAAFTVWTNASARAMLAGDTTVTALGKGTVQTASDGNGGTYNLNSGDLMWVGNSRDSENYFLVVQSTSTSASRFMLKITGNYLSFAGAVAQAAPATTNSISPNAPAVLPSTGQSAAPAPQGSNGPDKPLALDGTQHTLGVGQQQWYAFQYPGPDADGNRPMVSLELIAHPKDGATFSVWDPNGIAGWANADPDAKPVGNGTLHPVTDGSTDNEDRFSGNLDWSGGFGSQGTYYVQVQQTGNAPVSYTLQYTVR